MCNCGSKIETLAIKEPVAWTSASSIKKTTKKMWPDVQFEYTGNTALTVIGNVTGSRYRFHFTNDVQLIDYRDASVIRNVPMLRKVN